jgi:hypothetical protein
VGLGGCDAGHADSVYRLEKIARRSEFRRTLRR